MRDKIVAPTQLGGSATIPVGATPLRWLQQRQVVRKKCESCGMYHTELDATHVHELLRHWGKEQD